MTSQSESSNLHMRGTASFYINKLHDCVTLFEDFLHDKIYVIVLEKRSSHKLCYILNWMTHYTSIDSAVFKEFEEFHIPHHTGQFHLHLSNSGTLLQNALNFCYSSRLH